MLIVPRLHCVRATLIRAHKPHVIGREIWVGVVDLVEPGRLVSILIVNHAAPGGAFVSHSCLDNCSARRDCDEKRTSTAIFHLGPSSGPVGRLHSKPVNVRCSFPTINSPRATLSWDAEVDSGPWCCRSNARGSHQADS